MPDVTKFRVTMTNYFGIADGSVGKQEVVDYVREDFLSAYVDNARKSWQSVVVSEEPDAGPGGYDGQTSVPEELNHDLAGQTFPSTKDKE